MIIEPRPPHRIPIWMGGMADPVLRRIARIADGWLPQFQPGPEARELLDRLRGYIREAGRAVDAVGVEGRLSLAQTPEEQWATAVQQWRDLDVDYLGVDTMRAGLASPQAHIDAIRRFKEAADRAR